LCVVKRLPVLLENRQGLPFLNGDPPLYAFAEIDGDFDPAGERLRD
jgi:hypothetical protein